MCVTIFINKSGDSPNVSSMYFAIEDVKDNTSTQENLSSVDIIDVKKDIFDLEEKIKTFKTFLQSELTALQIKEQEMTKKINEEPVREYRRKIQSKLPLKSYNEIIPSPVRILINSPFKSVEVQQFHDFMKNSRNRFGGWNEYNHHIFVQCWQKYFYLEENSIMDDYESNTKNSHLFQIFLHEIVQKIPSTTIEDVISHSQWYTKYTKLKERQQIALDKWRANRRKIKRIPCNPQEQLNFEQRKSVSSCIMNGKLCKNKNYMFEDTKLYNLVSDEFIQINLISDDKMSCQVHNNSFQEKQILPLKCTDDLKIKETKGLELLTTSKSNLYFSQSCDEHKNRAEALLRLVRPTKQWKNKCKAQRDIVQSVSVENISKLHIPKWRLGL